MSVEYRRMRPEDEDRVVALWAHTFGSNDPERSRRYIRISDPDYLNHTLLAVSPESTVLATLRYYVYSLRNADGTPQLVSCISHVTTREEARRQGHACNLLNLAFQAMRAEGCLWMLLFPARSVYPSTSATTFITTPTHTVAER